MNLLRLVFSKKRLLTSERRGCSYNLMSKVNPRLLAFPAKTVCLRAPGKIDKLFPFPLYCLYLWGKSTLWGQNEGVTWKCQTSVEQERQVSHNWRDQTGTETTGVRRGTVGTKDCMCGVLSVSGTWWPCGNVKRTWSEHAVFEDHSEISNVLWNLPI